MLGQDVLRSLVDHSQGLNDDVHDGRGLLLVLGTHQLQEVLSVRESYEDQLRSLAQHPVVVGS